MNFDEIDSWNSGNSATLRMDGSDDIVTISGANASTIADRIARAVNRDGMFSAVVAALSPFRSDELGGLLVGMIDQREYGAEEAERRLRRLISMIDVILNTVDAAEFPEDDADAA